MGDPPGPSTHDLDRLLRELARPGRDDTGGRWGMDFFATVRRLECAAPQLPRIGTAAAFAQGQEPFLFGQDPSLRFAPRSIDGVVWCPRTGWPRLLLNCFGLMGPSGPMPTHITEFARDRLLHHRDPTIARFFDIFNHRMAGLFYRAWALNQLTVSHDRAPTGDADSQSPTASTQPSLPRPDTAPVRDPDDDHFERIYLSFAGVNGPGLRRRDAVPDRARAHFSGRLVASTRTPEGLSAILASYFAVPATVREFVGRWVELPSEFLCRLGIDRASATLGSGSNTGKSGPAGVAVAGRRIWDCQSGFRIILGPMSLPDYERLLPMHRPRLPGGRSFQRLEAWVRTYIGDELAWDVQLVLRKEEVPRAVLGKSGRLGWTTWLRGSAAAPSRDADNLVLQPSPL